MKAISICIGRKGSKGLPGKNTMLIKNKPMAYYPMNAALGSKIVSHSFLSTDDERIKEIGLELGHECIDRPKDLATSEALGEEVFSYTYREIIRTYPNLRKHYIVLLFCNAPTINSKIIDEGLINLNEDNKADSVVTVSKFNMWSPIRARKLNPETNYLNPFVPFSIFGDEKTLNCDRDSQGDVLFANMSVSIVKPKCLLEMDSGLLPQKWMGKNIKPIYQEFGCDVDYLWQVPMVEFWVEKYYK